MYRPQLTHEPSLQRAGHSASLVEPIQSARREVNESVGVVLVLTHSSVSLVAIQRAVDIADATNAMLHVVLVLPPGWPRNHPALLAPEIEALVMKLRRSRPYRFDLLEGTPSSASKLVARHYASLVVVVDGAFAGRGTCQLVEELRVPVVVARLANPMGAVVGATRVNEDERSVIDVACSFARFLARGMSLMKREDIVSNFDASARAHDADLVVIGHRPQTWLDRLLGRELAERLIETCQRSVVVVPLAD